MLVLPKSRPRMLHIASVSGNVRTQTQYQTLTYASSSSERSFISLKISANAQVCKQNDIVCSEWMGLEMEKFKPKRMI